ncbi:MAG: esterase-like activity of phytase family protein [Kiritimatiellae bacterium]|nr:esterase-like activity of phytase family protein [Kiritimatiellia bacterium]
MAAITFGIAVAMPVFAGSGFRWSIEEINEVVRPDIPQSANLGGIVWVSNDIYMAATDWNCVIWQLKLPHDTSTGKILSCEMERICAPEMTVDVEGMAIDPADHSIWIADERAATIRQHSPTTGKALSGNVAIPESLKGFRRDSGLESLAISRDGLSMWTCTEEALSADGPRATRTNGSDVRLTKFARKSAKDKWVLSGQWVYRVDPLAGGPWYNKKKKNLSRSGVSELCLTDDGALLVLEREFSVVLIPRLRCRIYEVGFSKARNVISKKDLSGLKDSERVEKKLLYEKTGFSMYEGMCLGPVLKDGSRMLVLVSDADKKSIRSVLSLRLFRAGEND